MPARPDYLWQIERGVVRTYTWLADGTIITLGLWGPGDVVGETLSKADPYQIETLTEVEAIAIPARNWHPPRDVLLSYMRQTEELMLIRAIRGAEPMVLKLLIWLASKFGSEVSQGYAIDLKITHQDLSELIGLTRVTVTRALSQLEQQGAIQRRSRRLVVLKEEDLWHYQI
jgi:CRP-like cAMP-binding protein